MNTNIANNCEWFIDNKLSIHFDEDKTKFILSGTNQKLKKGSKLNIDYNDINIKQHPGVTYLGCILDNAMSGESMALKLQKRLTLNLNCCVEKRDF